MVASAISSVVFVVESSRTISQSVVVSTMSISATGEAIGMTISNSSSISTTEGNDITSSSKSISSSGASSKA